MKPNLGLQDIQGLDSISWWPLAVGWWIVIGVLVVGVALAILLYNKRKLKIRRWQHQVMTELRRMESQLTPENSQATAISLAELVRRLAIHRYSRKECASLLGDNWLMWLSEKDPTHFNWCQSARSLIEAPFSPFGKKFDVLPIKKTIHATKDWVK